MGQLTALQLMQIQGTINNVAAGAAAGSFAGRFGFDKSHSQSNRHVKDVAELTASSSHAQAIDLHASDTSTINVYAGGLAWLRPTRIPRVAAGISVATNTINTATKTRIDNSKITSGGGVDVTANSAPSITAWTIGVAVAEGKEGSGLKGTDAGAGSGNEVVSTTEAYIVGCDGVRGVYANGGPITISATDDSNILAVAGALALSGLFEVLRTRSQGSPSPITKSTTPCIRARSFGSSSKR